MPKMPKNAKIYICEHCNFKCSKQSNYSVHILTAKHQLLTNPNEKMLKNAKIFICSCGKEYKHSSTLCSHKKKCRYVDNIDDDISGEIQNSISEPPSNASTVLRLLKQNDEFKELMVEQHSAVVALQKQNMELNKKLIDVVKDGTIINNNTTNNNTTNNNQFNLNFFLNDTCKDAMNITDFLGNLDVQLDELEYIGHHGYVNGMTKMIMERLKEMDVTKRPIHCTDVKRETMYIKDKDEWCKDTDELVKLRRILNSISMNNYRTVPAWQTAHPDSEVMDSRNYNFCYKMMQLILGDVEDEQIRLDNKIIKTIAKDLFVNKNRI
uniref:C2H2-type domain-containing protein n=1 Tax=viral metagenome TaxID=1070528 RepID=A0A6C0J3X6_9ZZZZ